jgi:hypothetical protein
MTVSEGGAALPREIMVWSISLARSLGCETPIDDLLKSLEYSMLQIRRFAKRHIIHTLKMPSFGRPDYLHIFYPSRPSCSKPSQPGIRIAKVKGVYKGRKAWRFLRGMTRGMVLVTSAVLL